MYKTLGIITGILAMILGIVILICSIAGVELPKTVMVILAIACIINAVLIIVNYKKTKNE